jgi:hypothetical protein
MWPDDGKERRGTGAEDSPAARLHTVASVISARTACCQVKADASACALPCCPTRRLRTSEKSIDQAYREDVEESSTARDEIGLG